MCVYLPTLCVHVAHTHAVHGTQTYHIMMCTREPTSLTEAGRKHVCICACVRVCMYVCECAFVRRFYAELQNLEADMKSGGQQGMNPHLKKKQKR